MRIVLRKKHNLLVFDMKKVSKNGCPNDTLLAKAVGLCTCFLGYS